MDKLPAEGLVAPVPKTNQKISSRSLQENIVSSDTTTDGNLTIHAGSLKMALRKSPISDVEEGSQLATSGRWSDSDPSPEALFSTSPVEDDPEPLTIQQYRSNKVSAKGSTRSSSKGSSKEMDKVSSKKPAAEKKSSVDKQVQVADQDDDVYDAPVIWLKKMFRLPEETIKNAILTTFRNAGQHSVAIVDMFISRSEVRDHSYFILNSAKASKLIIDGTLSVVVTIPKRKPVLQDEDSDQEQPADEEDKLTTEDIILWFEKGNHLTPAPHQDAFTLYLWQLPKDLRGSLVEGALREKITLYCPIIDIMVDEDEDGLCTGWAKIHLNYEFDTQKCVYMLNYRQFLGVEIRASFSNTDRGIVRKPPKEDRSRKSNPRPPERVSKSTERPSRSTERISKPRSGPAIGNPKKEKTADEWQVVGREGRRK